MEDRHMQASLARARAELLSATKELDSEKMGIEQSRRRLTLEIERVKGGRKKAAGELESAKGNLEKRQKDFDRFTMLTNSGAVSAAEMDRVAGDRDRASGMFNAASGVLESAESNYQKAMNELDGLQVRESRLEVLESQIAVARAKLDVAEADQEATVIQAPEDGRVLERIVEVGGSAKVGEPMISLWIGHPWVEAWADERDLRKIKIGSAVDISLDSSPQRKWTGRVESIGLLTDKQLQVAPVPSTLHAFIRPNAMVPVRIALDEENGRAQLGLSVVVGIRKISDTSEANGMSFFRRLFSWTQKRASTN
jgi:membrane fusion protein (multidrug efflux system)